MFLNEFQKWLESIRNLVGKELSRDRTQDIRSYFKNNPGSKSHEFMLYGQFYTIERPDWIDNISSSDIKEYFKKDIDEEIIVENVKLAKQKQRFMDSNRIERKSFREYARIENALTEYNKELNTLLKDLDLGKIELKTINSNNKACGLIDISDIHFNEIINLDCNKYDFSIASKRLKLLISRAKLFFNAHDITDVVLVFGGDLLNSDRRLDEKLNMATNRAKATLLSFYILEQMILDLLQDYKITLVSVSGNESRSADEMGFSDMLVTDNYDFTIFNMLKIAFRNVKNINFVEGNHVEELIKVANQTVLVLHGSSIGKEIEKSVQQIIGKYSLKGIRIDYILIHHIHSARIGDIYARNSSVCGANAYSDRDLQLSSRASQNIAIFYHNGSRDVIKVDLQNTDNIEGYDIIKQLEEYNPKSADKCKNHHVIFEVVI